MVIDAALNPAEINEDRLSNYPPWNHDLAVIDFPTPISQIPNLDRICLLLRPYATE